MYIFFGIQNLYGIELIRKLLAGTICSEKIMCIGTGWEKINKDCPDKFTDMKELSRLLMQKIEFSDNLNCEKLDSNEKISIWYLESTILYEDKYLDERKKKIASFKTFIEEMAQKFSVKDITLLFSSRPESQSIDSCIYGDIFPHFRKIQRRYGIGVNMFLLPFENIEHSYSNGEKLKLIVEGFITWIRRRIPNYFDDHTIALLETNLSLIEYDEEKGIENIVGQYRKNSNLAGYHESIKVETKNVMLRDDFSKQISERNLLKLIDVTMKDQMNFVDCCLDSLVKHYLADVIYSEAAKVEHICGTGMLQMGDLQEKERVFTDKECYQKKEYMDCTQRKRNYDCVGKGEVIVIINAYGVSEKVWNSLVRHLSIHYKVIYFRLNGIDGNNADSGVTDVSYGISRHIKDIKEILRKEKVDKFHIISWCSGAKIAVYLQDAFKERVLSMIFIAGEFAPYAGSKPFHSSFRENIQIIDKVIKDNPKMADFYIKIIKNGMFNKPLREYSADNTKYIFEIMPIEFRDSLLEPFKKRETMVNFLNMCIEYYEHDITDLLKGIRIPTLFISAEYDQISPNGQSKWASSIVSGSKHVCFPVATHFLILERTKEVYLLIRQHLLLNNNKLFSEE